MLPAILSVMPAGPGRAGQAGNVAQQSSTTIDGLGHLLSSTAMKPAGWLSCQPHPQAPTAAAAIQPTNQPTAAAAAHWNPAAC